MLARLLFDCFERVIPSNCFVALRGYYLRTFGVLPTQRHNGLLSNCKIMNYWWECYPKNKIIGTGVAEASARALLRLEKLLLTCLTWITLYQKDLDI